MSTPLGMDIGQTVYTFSSTNFVDKRTLSRFRKCLGGIYDDFIKDLEPVDLISFGEPNISGALSINVPKTHISDVAKIFREEYKTDESPIPVEDVLKHHFLHSFDNLIYPTNRIAEKS